MIISYREYIKYFAYLYIMVIRIIKGKGRGKSVLGYATANAITSNRQILGKEGAWYVTVNYNNILYKGTCGVSKKGTDYVLETHILDFNEDLYDKDITIDFKHKLRNSIIFKTLDESRTQLEKDINMVENYKSCDDCKFCVYQDYGYSNYTVEGTNISCLADKFEEYEQSYNDVVDNRAITCDHFNKGESWHIDVDRESECPSDEWIKTELRDFKIKNILN